MLSTQTQRKIRQLELVTKKLMNGPLVGDDSSARRGYGVELDQLREYQFGDDVRFIDFKSSCRLGKMMVKECLEERNRRVIIAIDVSASSFYGSQESRFEKIKEVAAILIFAAQHARDSVGLVFFAHDVLQVFEPKNTAAHIHQLVNYLYEYQLVESGITNVVPLLRYCARRWHKDALVFLVSDFIVDDYERALRAAARHVDLVAVRCYDSVERALPAAGYILTEDIEHHSRSYICTHHGVADVVLNKRVAEQNHLFARAGVDMLDVAYDHDSCAVLIDFFKRRMVHATSRYG